jgi:exonuclease III
MSFARDTRGRLRAGRGERWDQGELGVVPGLRDLGFADAFRALHGYAEKSPSWTWSRIAGHGGGYRIDHVFTSAELRPVAAVYHHAWRDAGLSDHSALEVEVEVEVES